MKYCARGGGGGQRAVRRLRGARGPGRLTKMKKQRSIDEVTCAEAGKWLGKVLKLGQIA